VGDEVLRRHAYIVPPESMYFDLEVDKVIWQQDRMLPVQESWEVMGPLACPLVWKVAVRLAVLAVQSADVERVCKAHGVIHTKSRNRLTNKSVQMLLFCYMNLRLLKKESTAVCKFLSAAL